MSIYYAIGFKKKNVNPEEIKDIAKTIGADRFFINKFKDGFIVRMLYMHVNAFLELRELFPFKELKDPEYVENEDYAFTEEEKEKLLNFFSDIEFLFFFNDCAQIYSFFSREQNFSFGFEMFYKSDLERHITFEKSQKMESIINNFKQINLDPFEIVEFL